MKEEFHWEASLVPGWAPNGDVLALKRGADGTPDLWRIPVDNREAQKLGPALRSMAGPISPDGRHIAFSTQGEPPKTEVWVLENFLPTSNARK